MKALLAPGQGSQKPGMLTPWLQAPGVRDRLTAWSEIAGIDLVRLGTVAEADEITDTSVTQPLVVASALVAYRMLRDGDGTGSGTGDDASAGASGSGITAGHSIGELAAAAIAGVLTDEQAVRLAAVRGREMARACAIEPTGMTALLGGDEAEVLDRLAELDLTPANRNAQGQIVAAGTQAALDELAAAPPARARLRPLAVAGAFHTRHMAPAREAFAQVATQITPSDPAMPLLSNKDGALVTTGADAMQRLVDQITSPVRWDLCSAALRDAEVTAIVELPPAGTLVGIAKRALRGVPSAAVNAPADLDALPVPA
ncbi:ACP S-malonyltransferase [Tomitella gaofuii]|uniref:ACP S-malonyltransferase n=1 Tax=Tomitella gaofuii TaxID=2760083 RepID=UPI0015F96B97|nr:ACP S-malonyltransferase [Tomitella gaofuii]